MDIGHLNTVSSYRKRSTTSTELSAVEEWLNDNPHKRAENQENGGIKRAVSARLFTANKNLSPRERKVFLARAKLQDKEARKILKQKEEANRLQSIADKKKMVADRRYARESILNSGGMLQLIKCKKNLSKLKADINHLRESKKMKIVLLSRLNSKDNYYVLDEFKRYKPADKDEKIETNSNIAGVREKLINIIKSEKLISADIFKYSMQNTALAMQALAMQESLDIYVLKTGMTVTGWILIPDKADDQ